eukprot:gene911-9820_t
MSQSKQQAAKNRNFDGFQDKVCCTRSCRRHISNKELKVKENFSKASKVTKSAQFHCPNCKRTLTACLFCSLTFSRPNEMMRHFTFQHESELDWCELCSTDLSTKTAKEKYAHLMDHLQEKSSKRRKGDFTLDKEFSHQKIELEQINKLCSLESFEFDNDDFLSVDACCEHYDEVSKMLNRFCGEIICRPEALCTGSGSSPCMAYHSLFSVHVEVSDGSSSRFYSYCLQVDQYSKLVLNGTANFIRNKKNSYIKVHAPPAVASYIGSNNSQIETKRYIFQDGDNINKVGAGFFSVVFNMEYGMIPVNKTGLIYENTCRPGSGFVPICQIDYGKPCVRTFDCGVTKFDDDVKVFIGFQGTDRIGANLMSAASTPMKFLPFTYGNFYDEINKP